MRREQLSKRTRHPEIQMISKHNCISLRFRPLWPIYITDSRLQIQTKRYNCSSRLSVMGTCPVLVTTTPLIHIAVHNISPLLREQLVLELEAGMSYVAASEESPVHFTKICQDDKTFVKLLSALVATAVHEKPSVLRTNNSSIIGIGSLSLTV